MASEHFRFLDLPAELRLLVYEHLEIETRLHTIEDHCLDPMDSCAAITIEIKSVPGWAILATCRAVFAEASPILLPKLEQIRDVEPVRLFLNTFSFEELVNSPLRNAVSPDTYKYHEGAGCYQYGKLPVDIKDRKTFDFVRQCGSYMRWNKSQELIVTVTPHPYDDNPYVLGWAITFENLECKVGMVVTGVELYDLPEDVLSHVNDGFLDMPCRVIGEAEWNELWAHEGVIGLDFVSGLEHTGRANADD
jgi:hypothetical protein